MTHVCCPSCRLRFTPAATAYLIACPLCDDRLQQVASLSAMFGYRLFDVEDTPESLPQALAVSVRIPEPPGARP
jgi:hypothetical protein